MRRLLSFLTWSIVLTPCPAGARSAGAAPSRKAVHASVPWSEASGFPPPRPLARTWAPAETTATPAPHPALHADARVRVTQPLFPRAGHAGRAGGREAVSCGRVHTVRRGDSLWAIAEDVMGGGRGVADAVQELYRANRSVIGDDPDLIQPGQVLRMPEGCKR